MTDDPHISIKFEGGDADQHAVDMKLLGRSLIGFDRIISDGVIFLMEGRQPKRGERAPLIVKAQQPIQGSQEIVSVLQEHIGHLALGWTVFKDSGGEIIWEWVKFVLEYTAGNKSKSDKALDAVLQMNRDNLAARDRSEERTVKALDRARADAMELAHRLAFAAIGSVAPVGPSTRSVTFSTSKSAKQIVDEPMADAIRAKGDLEVSELMTLTLVTDGWTYHSRVLSVHHPEKPGRFISAKVRDPLGEVDGNVYADAARDKATIVVQGKIARRAGEIDGIYIMDYGARRDHAA